MAVRSEELGDKGGVEEEFMFNNKEVRRDLLFVFLLSKIWFFLERDSLPFAGIFITEVIQSLDPPPQ